MAANTYDLQQGEVSDEHVVERHVRNVPRVRVVVQVLKHLAMSLVIDDLVRQGVAKLVDAAPVFTAEQVDSHDAEYEPEDETD